MVCSPPEVAQASSDREAELPRGLGELRARVAPSANGPSMRRPCEPLGVSRSGVYDGKGRWMDDVFIGRLWRLLQYDGVHLNLARAASGQVPAMNQLQSRLEAIRVLHPGEWAWVLIGRGEEAGMLPAGELAEMVASLEQGQDWTSDELSFDFIGDELRVRFLDDATMTAPGPVIEAFRSILEDQQKQTSARSSPRE